MDRPANLKTLKQKIRKQVQAALRRQPDKDLLSRTICGKLADLAEYQRARTVMFYIDFGCEVRTRLFLSDVLGREQRIVIPYCLAGQIELFPLQSFDELELGTYGILEPKRGLQERPDRRVDPSELDMIVVPGLAFDRRGGRLGRGKGYYDKLLENVSPNTTLAALAFECQIVAEVPMAPHDVQVDKVITEIAIYERIGG